MRLRDLRFEIDWFRFLRLLDAGGLILDETRLPVALPYLLPFRDGWTARMLEQAWPLSPCSAVLFALRLIDMVAATTNVSGDTTSLKEAS